MKRRIANPLFMISLFFVSANELVAQSDLLNRTDSVQMPFTIASETFAVWSGGALVYTKDRFSSAPIIQVFDRTGKEISKFTFSIPRAELINLYDNSIARGRDGALAIAGTAYSDDSRTGMFVAWVSPNQQEQTIIRTSPFFPRAVTIASDGTIWVAGDEMKPRTEKPDYSQHIIRRYDKTGKLLGSFLSWAGFETHSPTFPPTVYSVLFPLADGIGWYSPRSNTYTELSLDGSVVRRLRTPQHAKTDVIQATACDDGTVFATTSIVSVNDQATWGIFALNREKSEWALNTRSGKWGILFGCDGNRLATTTDFRTLSWLSNGTK